MKASPAVHSVTRFAMTVPDVEAGARFYDAFGLDVRRMPERIDLYTYGHPQCWGSLYPSRGSEKKLAYMGYGLFAEDLPALQQRAEAAAPRCEPHPLSDGAGLWLRDPDGVPIQLLVAAKVSPSAKSAALPHSAAPGRSRVARVHPRRFSHVLRFTPDVPRMVQFCTDVLGLRLSDKSQDTIAFLHSPHGSDHHLVAFAKSEGPGLHHSSWEVGSIDEVGCGAEQMRAQGYGRGWGVGRHVIGSNYFYYAQDPWGSFAEYTFDIEFIAAGTQWRAADHPPEDSFYVWGPPPPDDFVRNYELLLQA